MNIDEVRRLNEMAGEKMSPEVQRALDRAIMGLLGEPRQEQRFKTFVKYSFFVVYLLFVVVTGVIVFGAILGFFHVDALWLERTWHTFGLGFGGMVGKELIGAFKSRTENKKIASPRLPAGEA